MEKEVHNDVDLSQQGIKRRVWSFIVGALATAVCIIVAIVLLPDKDGSSTFWFILAPLSFTLVSCLILNNNFIGDVMGTIFEWSFVTFPGLIYSLDLDGIIWFLTVKLLFWLIGIVLALLFGFLAIACGLVLSIFVYPYAITKNFKNPGDMNV